MAFTYLYLLMLGHAHQFARTAERAGETLLRQYLFKEFQCPGIVGLAEPEHGLLAHFGIAVGLRDFNQFGNAFVFGQLAQRKNSLRFDVGVGIVFDGASNGADRAVSGFVGEPEERLAADMGARVVVGHANHFVNGARFSS